MMARWTHPAERIRRLPRHNGINSRQPGPGGNPGGLQRIRIHQCITVNLEIAGLRRMAFEVIEIIWRVHAQNIRIRRFTRLGHTKQAMYARRKHLIIDGIEPLRAFRMPIAHFVQVAGGMSNI